MASCFESSSLSLGLTLGLGLAGGLVGAGVRWAWTGVIHRVWSTSRTTRRMALLFRVVILLDVGHWAQSGGVLPVKFTSLFLRLYQFTISDGIVEAGPGIVEPAGQGQAEGSRSQCADKGNLQRFRGGRRKLKRIFGIFVGCVLDRDLGNAASYESIEVVAVAHLGDPIVGSHHHDRLIYPPQAVGQALVGSRGIEQDAARDRGAFGQRDSHGGTAIRVPGENDLARIDAAIDYFRLTIYQRGNFCHSLAVSI